MCRRRCSEDGIADVSQRSVAADVPVIRSAPARRRYCLERPGKVLSRHPVDRDGIDAVSPVQKMSSTDHIAAIDDEPSAGAA